ncbi:MAG TPA: metallophosphoesterase [Tepidisphaeraceae bacterium]|jgi:hypothetical protein|nr:metallophosphoesterase [Tepidisphaeraceae bacterium]
MLFAGIAIFVLGSEVLFWLWAHRRLGRTRHHALWRTLLHTYMTFQSTGFILIFLQRVFNIVADLPTLALAAIYLWHILILPFTTVCLALGYLFSAFSFQSGKKGDASHFSASDSSTKPEPTRRELLLAGATAIPPLLTGVTVATAMMQLNDLRVREFTIPLPSLPPNLDGLTIAHVSDTHVGRFTYGQKLKNISDITNSLRCDLVLLTGDLIDYSLHDLPDAIEMVKRMDPRSGLFLCQGNHDCFQSRDQFDAGVRAAGLTLLSNQSVHLRIRNQAVQIFGTRWPIPEDYLPRSTKDAAVYNYIPALAAERDPDAFPILMAHHPHAFDPAAACGFPITLAGHTHGGQLMLTDNIGAGPIFYRYWSGLYTKPNGSATVISNGVGNWFPLRTHAPAEIIKITLRCQT